MEYRGPKTRLRRENLLKNAWPQQTCIRTAIAHYGYWRCKRWKSSAISDWPEL